MTDIAGAQTGPFDLLWLYGYLHQQVVPAAVNRYLRRIEDLHPIRSRQAAAVAIATVEALYSVAIATNPVHEVGQKLATSLDVVGTDGCKATTAVNLNRYVPTPSFGTETIK